MNPSDQSAMSDSSDPLVRLLPPHGGYQKLRSFQTARLVYDGTLVFCDRFIEKRSRTHDQMVQAARSGVQNIAEGSMASGTSKKTELKLTNVARASLEELMLDCQDYLRQHGLRLWAKDSSEALAVRRHYQSAPSDKSDPSDPYALRTAPAETAANTLICLINQASYLLNRQLQNQEQAFLQHGGFTERLHAARTQERSRPSNSSDKSGQSDTSRPLCPRCAKPMLQRTARKGPHAGQPFWGCSAYPDCTGTRPFTPSGQSDQSDASDSSDKPRP
ncbi:MAG: four helix bundle suffix domain-containing protein [Verrucomicrobia bacterium]|nr:four helix bundle suffix domain-containing protein [Verrucomicrobiota bacterium]